MRRLKLMVSFRQKLMTAALALSVSFTVVAQKGSDNSNRPKKPDPPQIVVKDKDKPPQTPPKGKGKP
jgi:hypothetical protein